MKIRIIETNKVEELEIVDNNGISWTEDLLGNHDATTYNTETEEYEMTQDDFEWWVEYIDNYNSDKEKIEQLALELDINESEIYDKINEQLTNDLDMEHAIKQDVIEEFRSRLTE